MRITNSPEKIVSIKVKDIEDFYSNYPSIEKKKNKIIIRIRRIDYLALWRAISLPIIRRVFPTLISEKIVEVQPMSLPSDTIFHLDFKFELVWRFNIISQQLVYVQKHNKDKNDRDIRIKCELKLK